MELALVARPHAGRLALAAVAGAATISCSIGLLGASGWLLARASQHPRLAQLAIAIVAVRAFGTARGFLRYGERLVAHDAALRTTASLRVALYERLSELAPAGLERDPTGDLLHRLIADVEALEDLYLRGVNPLLIAALTSTVAAGVAWLLLPAAGVVLAVALLAGGLVAPPLAARAGRTAGRALTGARSRLSAEVVDLVEGSAELVAFGAGPHHLDRLARTDAELARLERRDARVAGLGDALAALTAGLAVVAVLTVAIAAASDGRIDAVAVAALGFIALAAFEAITPLPAAWSKLGALAAAAGRVADILHRPPAVPDPAHPRPLGAGPHTVEVIGARLSYDGGATWVLDGVDLRLEPGRCVGLTGPSGAGKTSLAHVLVRFRDLTAGRVLLDGHDVTGYRGDDVRRVVGLVEQAPHLFPTSIRDNLRLARPDATDDDLAAVAREAGLLDWIRSLPDGWDTDVGEAGARISGGERRRIAVARALLAGFLVIVLDEPTADVDPATAHAITRSLLAGARTRNRALLLVSHRPEDLAGADETLVLDRGRLRKADPLCEATAS